LEDPVVDVGITLRWIYKKWDVEVWTGFSLLNERDRWRALVTAVMNF
jgi:hypothetical protein